eukprot:scaffold524516_cov37-Prasinocladus_malaysianus.AAC.1
MEKVLAELRDLVEYRSKYFPDNTPQILATGLSSRKNMCIHPSVSGLSPPDCTERLQSSQTSTHD